jgi:hypothetical protein
MAFWIDQTEKEKQRWLTTIARFPRAVRHAINKFELDPAKLYTLGTTKYRVVIVEFQEDGTLIVGCFSDLNKWIGNKQEVVVRDRLISDVPPEMLAECDYPLEAQVEAGQWHPPLTTRQTQDLHPELKPTLY